MREVLLVLDARELCWTEVATEFLAGGAAFDVVSAGGSLKRTEGDIIGVVLWLKG